MPLPTLHTTQTLLELGSSGCSNWEKKTQSEAKRFLQRNQRLIGLPGRWPCPGSLASLCPLGHNPAAGVRTNRLARTRVQECGSPIPSMRSCSLTLSSLCPQRLGAKAELSMKVGACAFFANHTHLRPAKMRPSWLLCASYLQELQWGDRGGSPGPWRSEAAAGGAGSVGVCLGGEAVCPILADCANLHSPSQVPQSTPHPGVPVSSAIALQGLVSLHVHLTKLGLFPQDLILQI